VVRLAAHVSLVYLSWVFLTRRQGAERWCRHGEFTLLAAAAAVVLVSLLGAPPRLFSLVFESRPLVRLGRLSYGLYLWHFPLIVTSDHYLRFCGRVLGRPVPGVLRLPSIYALSLLVATLSFHAVERPFLRLKPQRDGAEREGQKL